MMFAKQTLFCQQLFRSQNPLICSIQAMSFSAGQRIMFGTDSPAYSNNYQKGLYHGRTHGQRRQRCFSMKYSI